MAEAIELNFGIKVYIYNIKLCTKIQLSNSKNSQTKIALQRG